jgi:ketosteroid isomerase-like protein
MNNMAVVDQVMDRILAQDLGSALHLMSADVELTLLPSESSEAAEMLRGREAVRGYFEALGAIITFWEVQLVPEGDQVLVLGRERYVTDRGLESDAEFMLVYQLRGGVVGRIVVVESLAAEAPLLPTVFCDGIGIEEQLS